MGNRFQNNSLNRCLLAQRNKKWIIFQMSIGDDGCFSSCSIFNVCISVGRSAVTTSGRESKYEMVRLKAPHDCDGLVKIKPPAKHVSARRAVHFLDVSAELRLGS